MTGHLVTLSPCHRTRSERGTQHNPIVVPQDYLRTCSPAQFASNIGDMDETSLAPNSELAAKIARLVEERGWNQEEFARIARLNRHTVRQILVEGGSRTLRNSTISCCARALGLSVSELR